MLNNVVERFGVSKGNSKEIKKLLVKTPKLLDFLSNVDKLKGEIFEAALKEVVVESQTKNKADIMQKVVSLMDGTKRSEIVGKMKNDKGVSVESMKHLVATGLVQKYNVGEAVLDSAIERRLFINLLPFGS